MAENQITSNLYNILDNEIVSDCQEIHNKIEQFIHDIEQVNSQLIASLESAGDDHQKNFDVAKNYQNWKIDKFNAFFAEKDIPLIGLDIEQYRAKLQEYINTFPLKKKLEQKRERFFADKSDSGKIKFIKSFKRFYYQFSIIPQRIFNLFRKVFKRKTKKISFWRYILPYRRLVSYQTENILNVQLTDILEDFSRANVKSLKQVLNLEQGLNDKLIAITLNTVIPPITIQDFTLDLRQILNSHKQNYQVFKSNVEELASTCDQKISELSDIVGTLEYPTLYLRYQDRKRIKDSIFKKLRVKNQGWGNTLFGLLEDWKIDQEIYNLNYFSKSKIKTLTKAYNTHIGEVGELLKSSQTKISQFKDQLINKLSTSTKRTKPAHIIQKELGTVKSSIEIENFQKASELLLTYNHPEKINHFESKIHHFLKEISEKRWLTKLTEYDQPFSSSDLDSFSPRELISFEYLPQMVSSCATTKAQIIQHIESVQEGISNIEQVVVFNLSSIIESIEKGDCTAREIPKLVEEGMDRSFNKLQEIIEALNNFEQENADALIQTVESFNESTLKLTINENAFNLRIIVMKAKAIKKSEEFGEAFLNKLKSLKVIAFEKSKIVLTEAEKLLIPWKKRIGFDEPGARIATELSDFLQEVYQKINNLPLIYQRLYKIMPLTEMSLFTGRKPEKELLLHAYDSWEKGKYSPTIIVGEKWSGHTTLINYFIETHLDKNKVIYEDRLLNIQSESEFLKVWQEILQAKDLKSIDDIAAQISKKHKGKVIILENLQNYYLRTIQGFETLKVLIKLIAKTNKDVFWLCTANIYAWNYLNKTIDISGYFGYLIHMKPFSDEELRELIIKKNNISGYKIIFTPSQKNLANKKYIKLTDEEKQVYLGNQFFNDLNGFAKGNISLALSYWLLSTTTITEESIEISNFSSPDFSFVSKLNSEMVFLIYLLVMHDGLNMEQLCKVCKKPFDKLQLLIIMLQDDGIIVEKNDRYEVNPLIYRHSINMLKSKNLIY